MDRATPVQMRQSLEIVDQFKKAGIRFVPMPVINDADFSVRSNEMRERLDTIACLAEKGE
ncbi:MAG: DUF1382 family protein [Planctomycetes bacterium]|nr:DUF1382 family protein [Planctomycetota bacterium]